MPDNYRVTELSSDDEEEEERGGDETPPEVPESQSNQQQTNPNDQTNHSLVSQQPKTVTGFPTPESTPEHETNVATSLRAEAHFAGLSNVQEESGFHAAFATALYTAKKARLHRDNLPPPPKSWRDINRHPYKAEFIQAAEREYKALQDMETFVETVKPGNKQILPLLWVFTYKFDTDGYVTKFKARICVRGDLQQPSKEDNYAATLAAKTLRLLCGIIAAFDLEATQFDAVNAFLHSKLEEEIYVQCPDGFS